MKAWICSVSVLMAASFSQMGPACADTFLDAVTFALTGGDEQAVQVLDQANCVFVVGPENKAEVFHLNNVDVGRLKIQPWKNIAGSWIEVELHGQGTVYEYRGAYEENSLQQVFQPREAKSFTLKLYTDEYQRLVRAWGYIYAHGCRSNKSSF